MLSRREALRTIGIGAAAGAITGSAAIMTSPSIATPHDPLLEAINDYVAARDAFNATDHPDDEDGDAHYQATVEPHYDRLKYETPSATTEEGALAALRLAWEEMQHSYGSFEKPLVGAALAYFDGRAS